MAKNLACEAASPMIFLSNLVTLFIYTALLLQTLKKYAILVTIVNIISNLSEDHKFYQFYL